MIETAHPSDGTKLRRLAELLCDFSAGRPAPREPLLPLIESLMVCCRDDCCADGARVSSIGFSASRITVLGAMAWPKPPWPKSWPCRTPATTEAGPMRLSNDEGRQRPRQAKETAKRS
jgi:hypothetical protein